jgi:hypothetical protein
MAGVEVSDEALDGTALARGIPALEHDAHGWTEHAAGELAAEDEPQVQESLLRGGDAGRLLLLRQPEGEIQIG